MTAHEMAGVCIAAAVGLLFIAPAAFDRWHKPRSARRFQQTARKAARAPRTEADVRRDLAAAKARQARIQARFDKKFVQIVAGYQADIPHQTRRTEDDQ
ncbi:hypothetical protein ACFXJO_05785 [Streptomyces lavendulae]|uniref:hypothetical protein n=1 Tax=Streptomyces lavendulae TaxID=1914 RepID=UPI0036CE62D0